MNKMALLIIGALVVMFPGHVLARSQKNDDVAVERSKVKVAKLGVGEKARANFKLRNGQKIKGYVSDAGQNEFTVTDRKSGQKTTIAYADVVEIKKPGMSKRTKIALGIGIGVVTTAAILAWAVSHSLGNFNLSGISIR